MEVRSTCGNCGNHIVEQCSYSSPPPDVVEAARRTMNRFGELDGEAWKDVQAVCEWVLSHKAIDK